MKQALTPWTSWSLPPLSSPFRVINHNLLQCERKKHLAVKIWPLFPESRATSVKLLNLPYLVKLSFAGIAESSWPSFKTISEHIYLNVDGAHEWIVIQMNTHICTQSNLRIYLISLDLRVTDPTSAAFFGVLLVWNVNGTVNVICMELLRNEFGL